MQRFPSEARIGDAQVRYRTRLEDDPSVIGSWEARNRLLSLFQTILHSPDLINCGLNFPHRISINHNGTAWVIEAEAISEASPL
jgi:hypothetical protein